MSADKPADIAQYREWLKKEHSIIVSQKTSNHYETVALKVCNDFKESKFWKALTDNLQKYNEEYLLKTSYPLFSGKLEAPQLCLKTFDSFLLKTFRNNVVRNINWPNPPEGGWAVPPDWFSKVNDIVRTCFVVKYFDGVEFLINAIEKFSKESNIDCWKYYVAGNDGYYAAHVYIRIKYEVPGFNFDTEHVDIVIELQVTSQLQEVIRKLLHKHFENRRKRIRSNDIEWQWDYKCDEFATNYLGHILHYLEGMIMEVRDKNIKSQQEI